MAGCGASTSGPAGAEPAEVARQIADRGTQALPFITGVVSNSGSLDVTGWVQDLSVPTVRVEFPIQTPVETVRPFLDAYARTGTRVLLLAGFSGPVPPESVAPGLGRWAAAFGPSSGRSSPIVGIEIGNETSYASQYDDGPSDASFVRRAEDYARLVSASGRAVRDADTEVSVLAQADDANTKSPVWVDSMFRAVPDLASFVTGWTIHPYGPSYAERIARARTQLEAHDAFKPLWITEWGLAFDKGQCLDSNYGWDRCMDDNEAASTLLHLVGSLNADDIAAFFVYQARDQRPSTADRDSEHYFGIETAAGGDKGAYTAAVRSLWAHSR